MDNCLKFTLHLSINMLQVSQRNPKKIMKITLIKLLYDISATIFSLSEMYLNLFRNITIKMQILH